MLSLGAKDGVRTRDLDLGKVALYQLSYFRIGMTKLVQKIFSANTYFKIPKIFPILCFSF